MSDFRAIAAVTTTLKALLQEVLTSTVPAAGAAGGGVTTERPQGTPSGTAGVNTYLYRIAPNAALRNEDAPTRAGDGAVVRRPRAAIDLQYLLSFDGDDSKLEPQRILGGVVRALHSQPTLARQQIRDALSAAEASLDLADCDLAEEVELVRLTPLPLSLEELSKLWSVFFQAPYRLSIAYEASVVLIDGLETPRQALPVLARNLYAVPFTRPVIERIRSRSAGGDVRPENHPILVGHQLVISGAHLRGRPTRVRLGNGRELLEPAFVSDTRVELPLLSPPLTDSVLRAGVHPVQIVHELSIGTPPVPHRGFESNVVSFVLCPRIDGQPVAGAGKVRVRVVPPIGRDQRALLLLDEADPPEERGGRAYVLEAPPYNGIEDEDIAATDAIAFDTGDVRPGDYFLRIAVDGVESPLELDTDPSSPSFKRFQSPRVTLP